MNFQVPQFIEQKAHIVGFLTVTQFLILIGAGGVCYIFFIIFNFFVAILLSLVVGGLAVLLALGKVNGQSAFGMIGSALGYVWRPRRYTWQRKFSETTLDTSGIDAIEAARKKMGIQEKLKSIALSVTTGKLFSGLAQPGAPGSGKERFQVVTYLTGEKKVAKRIDYR